MGVTQWEPQCLAVHGALWGDKGRGTLASAECHARPACRKPPDSGAHPALPEPVWGAGCLQRAPEALQLSLSSGGPWGFWSGWG